MKGGKEQLGAGFSRPKAGGADKFLAGGSRRRRPEGGEKVSLYLPHELAEEFRMRCVKQRRSMSDAVSEAIAAWLKSTA